MSMLIHPKLLTAPLSIVKRFVDAGYSTSDALAKSISVIEEACDDSAGADIALVLQEAEMRAEVSIREENRHE